MYNPQLKTFIAVADEGSFNRASEKLHLSVSATMRHINLLEQDLGLTLFERTARGMALTEGGKILYKDASHIITYCDSTLARIRKAALTQNHTIRIGSSIITPPGTLLHVWPKIRHHYPEVNFKLVSFENNKENARYLPSRLGQQIDVVPGVFDEAVLRRSGCGGLVLMHRPLCCGVSLQDPLSQKDFLTVEDLYDRDLMVVRQGWTNTIDAFREDMRTRHPRIRLIDFDFYSVETYNRCESTNSLLLCFGDDLLIHPLIRILPVKWDYTIPCGLLHPLDPPKPVRRFLDAVSKAFAEE